MASIYEGLVEMFSLFLSFLSSGTPSLARDSFYPPLNHTTYITDSSLGPYGGIYAAPADQPSPASDDVYNYCSMPHPRADTYVLPSPIANSSVEARLVYLEYMQRHQRRTPYNILPAGENQPFICDTIHPHLYAAPDRGPSSPALVYGQAYSDPTNPFLFSYVNGSCQYPQLTIGGLLDAYQHGRDLRAVYGEKLGLIPSSPDQRSSRNGNGKVWLRSTSSPLTQSSASGVLRGVWPDHDAPIPLHQQASGIDTLDRGFPCAARDSVLDTIQKTPVWNEHFSVTADLRDRLAAAFNANVSSWMSSFDHFADNFQARLCNGYELPCSKDGASCVTIDDANTVFRAGDWEWNYWWRYNDDVTRYIQLVEGLFIGEVVRKLEAVQKGRSDLVYSHTFLHDGDIGPVLGALGIKALRWPGMAANVAIEVWEVASSDLYVRVLYSGRAVETVHGTLDWIPLSKLLDILRRFVPEDIISMCNA